METILLTLKNYALKYKYYLIFGLIFLASLITNCIAIKSCSNAKSSGKQNVIALTDTIVYYKTKSGEIAASKNLLEGDLSTLKIANDSLYQVIKDMKVSDPSTVVYVKSTVDNPKKDTVWKIKDNYITQVEYVDGEQRIDTIYEPQTITEIIENGAYVKKDFAFNDEYRSLEGYVSCNDTTLGLSIEKDQVYFDYTLAVEDSKVYLKSNNPYIKFDEITGLTIPTEKKKKWGIGIGPQIGYGYDFVAKKASPYVGVGISVNYNLFRW